MIRKKPKQKSRPPDDAEQSARFVETAKNLEIHESGENLESVMGLLKPPNDKDATNKNRQSKQ